MLSSCLIHLIDCLFILKTDNEKNILIDESEEIRRAIANSILSKLAGGQDIATTGATSSGAPTNKTDEPSTALNPKLFQPKYYFDQYEELILRPEGIFSRIGMFKFQLGHHLID